MLEQEVQSRRTFAVCSAPYQIHVLAKVFKVEDHDARIEIVKPSDGAVDAKQNEIHDALVEGGLGDGGKGIFANVMLPKLFNVEIDEGITGVKIDHLADGGRYEFGK